MTAGQQPSHENGACIGSVARWVPRYTVGWHQRHQPASRALLGNGRTLHALRSRAHAEGPRLSRRQSLLPLSLDPLSTAAPPPTRRYRAVQGRARSRRAHMCSRALVPPHRWRRVLRHSRSSQDTWCIPLAWPNHHPQTAHGLLFLAWCA